MVEFSPYTLFTACFKSSPLLGRATHVDPAGFMGVEYTAICLSVLMLYSVNNSPLSAHNRFLLWLLLNPRAHFTPDYSLITLNWYNFYFAFSKISIGLSQQIFAHATTTVLSWHVQNFVVMISLRIELQQNFISMRIKFWVEKHE